MVGTEISAERVIGFLKEIPDPDIPVVNIVEMGMVRTVEVDDDTVVVEVTPTYSGCPATKMITDDIIAHLKEKGIENARVKMVYSPAWTTDWMGKEVKEKLRYYGIAPPEKRESKEDILFCGLNRVKRCPYCESKDTRKVSEFGSTPCKAIYNCNSCCQPFEVFKCI